MNRKKTSSRTGTHKYPEVSHPHGGKFAAWKAQGDTDTDTECLDGERNGVTYTPTAWEYTAYSLVHSDNELFPVVIDDEGDRWMWEDERWRKSDLPTRAEMKKAFSKPGRCAEFEIVARSLDLRLLLRSRM